MKITRYILFYLFVLIFLLLFFYSDKRINKSSDYTYLINEEAIPIRDYDEIKGMKYTIEIDDMIKDESIDISSSVLSSIYHYKDFNSIDNFFVNLEIDSDYDVYDISIVDRSNNLVVSNLDYKRDNNYIVIYLDKEVFSNYKMDYYLRIKVKRNTRKI